ncbi:MAG: hypothetical protein DLM58_22750 [Pseudonocardiales bacterium]|nr:MAG: hypothetical protein DLM58_22750 [Pseudonocardiales bacterium]
MGHPQELTFSNEGIKDLASDVDFLMGEINAESDNNRGNIPDFHTAGDISSDVSSLAGGGTSAYADAYNKEHNAVADLYSTLQGQLGSLKSLLSHTGATYQTNEVNAQQAVAQTNPDAGPSGPVTPN